jgi:hypothetical protein
MHQGKDGLAFIEAFLAQMSTSGRSGSGPSSGAGSGSTVPAYYSKTGTKQYINSGLLIGVCHFFNIIITCDFRKYFDNFWCIKY